MLHDQIHLQISDAMVSLKTKYLANFQIQLASTQVESKSGTEQPLWQTFSHK